MGERGGELAEGRPTKLAEATPDSGSLAPVAAHDEDATAEWKASSRDPGKRLRPVTIGVAAALIGSLVVRVLWPSAPPADGASLAPTPNVEVLMPYVESADSMWPASAAASLHDVVLDRLAAIDGPNIVAFSRAESVPDLRRFLARVGGGNTPEWVLSIRIQATKGEAWVTGILYRGSDYTVVETLDNGYHYETDEDVLIRLPRRIAEDIVAEFRTVLEGGGF